MRASISLSVALLGLAIASGPAGAQRRPAGELEVVQDAPTLRVPATLERGAEIEVAIQARAWDRAERLLAAEIERAPSADLLKLLAQLFMIDRKPLNAAVAIKRAEALAPLDDRTRFTLALAYISLGRRDWAAPELERLTASDPSSVIYSYWLARLDYDGGQYASAIRRLEGVLARDPRFMRAYDNLGLCFEAQHQPEQAIAKYREAIRLNRAAASRSPWPPLNLGLMLRQRGELQEAEALLREAVSYDVGFAQGHYQLGTLLEERGRTTEAEEALGRAVAADPTYPEPHYALSRIYRRQSRIDRADAALATFHRLRGAQDTDRR